MDKNNVSELLETIFKGVDGFATSKTVVGEPIKVGNATLIPLMEVSVGMGAGGFNDSKEKKNGNGGPAAMSSRITPTAMLIFEDGRCRLVNVKNQDSMMRFLDMLPDLVDRITGGSRVSKKAEREAERQLSEAGPSVENTTIPPAREQGGQPEK